MHQQSVVAGCVVVQVWLMAACGDLPASPSTSLPSTHLATALTVTGPGTIAPGATVQFIATLQMADGSTADVTALATWSSGTTNPPIVESRGRGAAFGRARGEAPVVAMYGPMRSQPLTVMVLEPGTFRIRGEILDADTRGQIGGALLVASDDGGRHVETRSDFFDGFYRLYGLSGAVRVTISAPSYPDHSAAIVVTDHADHDFVMARQP